MKKNLIIFDLVSGLITAGVFALGIAVMNIGGEDAGVGLMVSAGAASLLLRVVVSYIVSVDLSIIDMALMAAFFLTLCDGVGIAFSGSELGIVVCALSGLALIRLFLFHVEI